MLVLKHTLVVEILNCFFIFQYAVVCCVGVHRKTDFDILKNSAISKQEQIQRVLFGVAQTPLWPSTI
jgi:hypothetical protein